MLATSGLLKLMKPRSLDQALDVFAVPAGARRLVALGLAVVEMVLAVLLLTQSGTAVLAVSAMFMFAVSAALILLNRSAPDVSCGCLGEFSSSDHSPALGRNALLILLLALAFLAEGRPDLGSALVGFQLSLLVIVLPQGVSTLKELRLLRRELTIR